MSNSRLKQWRTRSAQALTVWQASQRAKGTVLSVILGSLLGFTPTHAVAALNVGPIFTDFHLTIDAGRRTEILGPLFFSEEREETSQWGLPPLMSYTRDHGVDSVEFDVLYPGLTYDRFGGE